MTYLAVRASASLAHAHEVGLRRKGTARQTLESPRIRRSDAVVLCHSECLQLASPIVEDIVQLAGKGFGLAGVAGVGTYEAAVMTRKDDRLETQRGGRRR